MADLIEHVQVLADEIGPRPVSTEEENQASLYVAQNLRDAGLEVDIDEFATPTGVRWPYALSFALLIAGTLLSGVSIFVPGLATTFYAVGLLLAIVSAVIYFTEHTNRPILSKMLARGVSQNIVARYVPSSVARERRRRKIIFVAHVDTVRAQPEAMPALVNALPVLKKAIYYCMIAVPVLLFVRLLPLPWPDTVDLALWIISIVACIFLFVCMGCIIANRFMPYVSGANDNASSIAVLLGLAKRLLDPTERERYAKEDSDEEVLDEDGNVVPVETFAPAGATGTFDAVELEAEIEGQVGGGAQVVDFASAVAASADGAAAAAETTVMPALQAADAAIEETAADAALSAEVPLGGAWPDPSDYVQVEEAAREPEPEPEPQVDSLPSWYTTAKRKAAAEIEASKPAKDEPKVRSRYADVPANREQARELLAEQRRARALREDKTPDVGREMIEAIQNRSVDDILVDLGVDPEEVSTNSETPAAPEPVAAAEEYVEPVVLDEHDASHTPDEIVETPVDGEEEPAEPPVKDNVISIAAFKGELAEADVDDLEPGLTGAFDADDVAEALNSGRAGLTGRIPAIGLSDDNAEAAAAFETYAAVDSGDAGVVDEQSEEELADQEQQEQTEAEPEKPLAPSLTGSFKALQARRAAAKEAKAAQQAAQPKRNAKPKARRAGADFEPTRVSSYRDEAVDMLSKSRQAAAVSSTYEDTIQAAPGKTQAFDPFAPKGDPAADASLLSPSASTSFPAVEIPAADPERTTAFAAAAPGAASSFPSLTSSFPSLTGSFNAVSAFDQPTSDDFDDSNIEAFNGFAPSMEAHIDTGASRFHNAMDKVGGLFSKFGRKKKEEDLGFDDGWENEDNGWKGGAYFDQELAANSHEAVRARAAQIRESVVSMTEHDLLDKEVWFVALGASNAGNRGMKNFLELHSKELRGALIVNLEAVGAGDICFVDYEGKNKPHRSDRRLQSLVRKASKEFDGEEMRAERLAWRDTDATPAMEAGVRAMTIMGFDGAAPLAWHWTNDYTGIVEEDKLQYVTSVLFKMIENS